MACCDLELALKCILSPSSGAGGAETMQSTAFSTALDKSKAIFIAEASSLLNTSDRNTAMLLGFSFLGLAAVLYVLRCAGSRTSSPR